MKVILIGANNPETARVIKAVEIPWGGEKTYEVIGFLDNDPTKKGTEFCGRPVFGGFEVLPKLDLLDVRFVNLITGSAVVRFETSRDVAKQGGRFTNLIHPSVDLDMVEVGLGNYVQEKVVIQAGVRMGNNASIHIGTLVGHEATIGNSSFLAHGVNVSGSVAIEDGVFIGTGVSIVPRVRIGRFSVIGAGSVIIGDIPPYSVVVGNPGKVIKTKSIAHEHGDPLRM